MWSAQTFESQIKWNWPGSQQTFTSGGPGLDKTFIEEWSYGDGSSDRQEYSLIGEDGEMKIIPKDNSDESTKDFGTRYHTYGDVGVYTVERRVTSSLGCAYGSIQIEIVERPTLYGDNNGDNE